MAAVAAYFERLGLDELFETIGRRRMTQHLADTVLVMVANRLLLPSSKRRLVTDWLGEDVALPEGVAAPSLDQCYRALDAVCATKEDIEAHCYSAICDLTNLDLRLCCYDLTSTYLEGDPRRSVRFASKAFGYSRDHRPDRPQVVIGLLVTGDGIPISHYVFAGNTADISTLPEVLDDLQPVRDRQDRPCRRSGTDLRGQSGLGQRGGLRPCDRHPGCIATRPCAPSSKPPASPRPTGLTSPAPTARPPRSPMTGAAMWWSPRPSATTSAARSCSSEDKLVALAERVNSGRLKDPAKISVAADRILRDSPVGRLLCHPRTPGQLRMDVDALAHEQDLLAGRYVISTSLSTQQASTADVVRHYRSLA